MKIIILSFLFFCINFEGSMGQKPSWLYIQAIWTQYLYVFVLFTMTSEIRSACVKQHEARMVSPNSVSPNTV